MLIAVSALVALVTLPSRHVARSPNICDTVTSRVGFSGMSGMPIRSVDVQTLPPALGWPRVAEPIARVHAATLPSTIRRELLFAPGDAIDSVRLAESLRRLRALGYLEDARLEARTCADSIGVALTVVTRDAWSTTPVAQLRSRSLALGVAEANAFGTGRVVRFTLRSDLLGFGAGASVRDPALWNGRLDGQIGSAVYGSGSSWTFALRPRKRTLADAWAGELRASGINHETDSGPLDRFTETRFLFLGGPRLTSSLSAGAVYVVAGAEADRADIAWSPLEPVIGPDTVRRRFIGGAFGIIRRAARYDTLGWVLRHDGIVDVPTVTEGELVAAYGRDLSDGRTKVHIDDWVARTWTSANRALITAGVWTTGYLANRSVQAGSARGSLIALSPTANGAWEFRAAAERLYDPDPIVRALRSVDPLGAMLPRAATLAQAATSISAERAFRLWDVTRVVEMDAALFGGISHRWRMIGTTDMTATEIGASIVGVGLRFAPSRTPGATLRLDAGYPLGYRVGVRARPVFAVSLVPWLTAGHQREVAQSQSQEP